MGYRSFKDSNGVQWDAWDVIPQLAERRVEDRRRTRQAVPSGDRRRAERRVIMTRRALMASGLSTGWLCFEGGSEKRRLSPIPDDWSRCPDEQLEEYCRLARPVQRPTQIKGDSQRPS